MSHPIHHHTGRPHQVRTRPIPPHFVSRAEAVHFATMPLRPNGSVTVGGRTVTGGQAPVVLNRPTRPNVTSPVTCHNEPVTPGVDIGLGVSRDLTQRVGQGAIQFPLSVTFLSRNYDAWHICIANHRLSLGREVGVSISINHVPDSSDLMPNWDAVVGASVSAAHYLLRFRGIDLFEAALTVGVSYDLGAPDFLSGFGINVGLLAQLHIRRTPVSIVTTLSGTVGLPDPANPSQLVVRFPMSVSVGGLLSF